MNCTKNECSGQLLSDNSDFRQEWSEEYYSCEKCGAEYTLRTEYKIQSNIIDTQVLYDENGEIVG